MTLNPQQFHDFDPRRTNQIDYDFTPWDFNSLRGNNIRLGARRSQRDYTDRVPYSDRARHLDDMSAAINPDTDMRKYARDVVSKSAPFKPHYIPKMN